MESREEDSKAFECASAFENSTVASVPDVAGQELEVFGNDGVVCSVVLKGKYQQKEVCVRYRINSTESRANRVTVRSLGTARMLKTLGTGSTAKVKLARDSVTGRKSILKIIPRHWPETEQETVRKREERVLKEAAILNLLVHPHIVRFQELYILRPFFCLLFSYTEGRPLLDHVLENGYFSEKRARHYFRQMVSAVDYLNRHGIVHRDLKIENILVDSKDNIRIIDFGLSTVYSSEVLLETYCGSLYFAAPELLNGTPYTGPEIDVWSLGVVLYVLVCGRVPFDDRAVSGLRSKIKRGDYTLPSVLSVELRDLLQRMLSVDPQARISVSALIGHPWTNQGYGEAIPQQPCSVSSSTAIADTAAAPFVEKEFSFVASPPRQSQSVWGTLSSGVRKERAQCSGRWRQCHGRVSGTRDI